MKPQKKIFIMITHGLHELDVIFPIITALKQKYPVKVELVIVVKKIYEQFIRNEFYHYCAVGLDCKISYLRLPNKFDPEFRRLMASSIGYRLLKLYFKVLLLWNLPKLLRKLISADCYMHEHSNQLNSTSPIYWIKKYINRTIYVYAHGHAFYIDSKATRKVPYADRVSFLLFHEHNKEHMLKLGYENQYTIGYPKFYKEWIAMARRYNGSKFEGKVIVLIYTRGVHPYFMDEDKYINLLITSCRVIRKKMDNILIVIKPHPREDTEFVMKLLKRNKVTNVTISWEHAAVLAKNAKIAISLWTSAILDSLSLKVPSVEFYIEAERFRECEPEGSAYKKLGIHSVDNEQELEEFFDTVLDDSYKIPPIIHEISQVKDIGFLELAK